jgi:hypothetical protein
MAGAPAMSASPIAELDEVSLARARRGDDDARRRLILHYQDRVFRYLWRMLACRGQAIDPTGEIYNVASKSDPLGHPAADCVEKAVLAAARFAPSTRVTGVPLRLSLEPTR